MTVLFPGPTGVEASVRRAIAASRASVRLPGVAAEPPPAAVEEPPAGAVEAAGAEGDVEADAGKHARG